MMAVDFISTMDILKPLVIRVRPWQVEAHYEMGAPGDTGAYLIATPKAPSIWSRSSRSYNILGTGSHTSTARAIDNAANIQ